MSETDHPTRSPREQALAWFVRLSSGAATEDERRAFAGWLRADAQNRIEYDKLEDLWSDLDAVPDPRHRPGVVPASRGLSRRRLLMGAAGAAACAGIVAASGLSVDDVKAVIESDVRTGTGERRTVAAPDGSSIDLDAETAVAFEFGDRVRRLHLLSGRATFTVAHDANRPFDVVCAGGTVRALGTAFTVHRRPRDTAVTVEESAVTVFLGAPNGGGDRVRLTAGQCVTYGAAGLGAPMAADIAADTAWRRGRLVFRERPLGDVVADLNRYRKGRIVIWDDALNALRIDGVFNVDEPDAVLNAIVQTLPVREARFTPYLVVLRSA